MKMRTIRALGLILISGLGFCGLPARANLRAPRRADGYLSGGLRMALPADAVRLVRENMRMVFPAFDSATPFRDATVRVELVYEFENAANRGLDLSTQFVAVDIRSLEVRLNEAGVPFELIPDAAEEAECLSRLAAHRRSFLEPLYRPFLQALKPDAPSAAKFSSIFGSYPLGDGTGLEFKTAKLVLRLRPGRNSLSIRYRQRPYVAEFRYGYFAAWPARGFTGFDYLLYPALSWYADKNFHFSVTVEIPYYHGRFLVFPRWDEPQAKSNVDLRAEKAGPPHVRILRGEFDRLPAEVLTVLVWFDPQAMTSLSGR